MRSASTTGVDGTEGTTPPERVPVLLVEDDARIRRALAVALGDEGVDVTETASADQALAALDGQVLALVDLMLPGTGGLELCRTIRARRDLPIIVVTARADTEDVIAGLEAGADDYVTKPVVPAELAARIRALLRRSRPAPPDEELRMNGLCIRPAENTVWRDGTELPLTRTEFRLLVELVRAGGRVVTREELLTRVWGYGYFGDTRLLDVHVRRLRRKVEVEPDAPRLVVTVRGYGYRAGE